MQRLDLLIVLGIEQGHWELHYDAFQKYSGLPHPQRSNMMLLDQSAFQSKDQGRLPPHNCLNFHLLQELKLPVGKSLAKHNLSRQHPTFHIQSVLRLYPDPYDQPEPLLYPLS